MNELKLNLSVFPVGPRESFEHAPGKEWFFAMQVAVSFANEPPDAAEAENWAKAMLPWKLFDTDNANNIDVTWHLVRPNGRAVLHDTATALATRRPDRLDLRRVLEDRFPQYAKPSLPPRVFTGAATGTVGEVTDTKLFLPPVLQAIGGSTPQLTSGELQCTWYFKVLVTKELLAELNEVDDDEQKPRLVVWPMHFFDTRDQNQTIEFTYQEADDAFKLQNGAMVVKYHPPQGDAMFLAQVLPFQLARLKSPKEPALAKYWLPTSDSRIDSVAEIHDVVATGLKFRARVNYLTPQRLLDAGVKREGAADAAADARLFLDIARRLFDVDEDNDDEREKRHERAMQKTLDALKAAKAQKTGFLDALREALNDEAKTWWTTAGLAAINARAEQEGVIRDGKKWVAGDAAALFSAFGLFVIPAKTDVRPVLPGEGIDVLLGDADLRLRHEANDADDVGNDSDHAQIAELGVLVRRAKQPAELKDRRWSLATAAVAALDTGEALKAVDRYWGSLIDPEHGVTDEEIPYHREPFVRGIKSAFVNGLSHTDITYYGGPLITDTVGSALHGIEGESDDPPFDELLPLSFQPVGPVRENTDHSKWSLVPPLRYGDVYQFAGFVIDRGGGIPQELVQNAEPSFAAAVEWSQLDPGNVPLLDDLDVYDPIEFLRRVPVGEVNVIPPPDTSTQGARPQWPPLPADVVLRAREWLSTRAADVENTPAILLSDGDGFSRQLPGVTFRVVAPSLDEHTISRWLMPAAADPNDATEVDAARKQLDALNDVLAGIHRRRDALLQKRAALQPQPLEWEDEKAALPFDPAVSKIGLRCYRIDENGATVSVQSFLDVDATVSVSVSNAENLENPIALRAGTFVLLEFVPLVKMSDYARFEDLAMTELTEDVTWSDADGIEYKAFRPSRVLVEAATPALPDEQKLYDAFTLSLMSNGAIEVALSPADGLPLADMAFVERYELARQRWMWRNRPIVLPQSDALQSELPKELGGADRDTALSVLQFDALSALDRGLVDRGRIGGRVPRMADGTPLAAARLLVDDRDAVSHADYLRFGCSLISRYAGVLVPKQQQVVACGKAHDDEKKKDLEEKRLWRRVTAPFRGDLTRLKAPKVLAILPLTQDAPNPHAKDVSEDATPFLIVLDEIWFREYGPGETLSVEVVLETKEIGETKKDERPFRVGPLPDHYVAAQPNLFGTSCDERQETPEKGTNIGNRVLFPAFGPFGHSLDRSGNEALANATAFIAYARKKVHSHYAAYVRMRRLLCDLDRNIVQEGPPGGTYALYTQPDAAHLATNDTTISLDHKTYAATGMKLQPTSDAESHVATQYRYLLLVGPQFRDLGRSTDLFLPSHAVWLYPDGNTTRILEAADQKLVPNEYRGRILELLLNGRYEQGEAPVEKEATLRDIFVALFRTDGNPEDAPGMIRRISPAFGVTVRKEKEE